MGSELQALGNGNSAGASSGYLPHSAVRIMSLVKMGKLKKRQTIFEELELLKGTYQGDRYKVPGVLASISSTKEDTLAYHLWSELTLLYGPLRNQKRHELMREKAKRKRHYDLSKGSPQAHRLRALMFKYKSHCASLWSFSVGRLSLRRCTERFLSQVRRIGTQRVLSAGFTSAYVSPKKTKALLGFNCAREGLLCKPLPKKMASVVHCVTTQDPEDASQPWHFGS